MKQTSILNYHDPRTKANSETECSRILETFQAYPKNKMTAHDVAELSGMNYFIIQKRLSILARRNEIEEAGIEIVNLRPRTLYKLV